jgi:hypothetical protein
MCNFFAVEHSCVKLTNCYAHLGSWLVAVGNAELSVKVMLYMMDQEVFVVKFFFPSGGSYAAVERQYIQVSVNVASSREYLVGC